MQAANHLRAARNVVAHRQTLVAWEVNRVLWALQGMDVPLVILKGAAYVLAACQWSADGCSRTWT